jgi:glycosyltransferase involved in cell wall biosynthesis
MALLTVILPVLNGMPYLCEALASLKAQTFRDFEVFLWDNGSTDGTLEEARKWIPSRIPGRVVTEEPLPLHLCLARMVEETQTEFCARMDADDVCLPHRFEQEIRYLEQNPDVSLVGCQIECIDPQGNFLPKENWARFPVCHEDIVTQMLFSCSLFHPGILFRTKTILDCGNYAVASPVEDLDLYLRIVQSARVANLSSVCMHYRIHPKSICAIAREGNQHEDLLRATVARYVEVIFGISPATYLQLRSQSYPLAILALLRSAFHQTWNKPHSLISIVFTPTFVFIGRCLTGKRDFVSKAVFRMIEFLSL